MPFQTREEYEAWLRRGGTPSEGVGVPGASPASSPGWVTITGELPFGGDIVLHATALYGLIVVFAGLVFTVLGLVPLGKAGPTFHTICLVVGPLAILGGVLLLRKRPVVATLTATALHLPQGIIPWNEIRSFERVRDARNYWIGINLKTTRTDLGAAALKARAALRALGSPGADFDYVILETDLPRPGLWFLEECRKRVKDAGGGSAS